MTSAGVRHLAFFEALATLEHPATTGSWRDVLAGLVVLRLFERRVVDAVSPAACVSRPRAVRRIVVRLDRRSPVRPQLLSLLDVLQDRQFRRRAISARRELTAYAAELRRLGYDELAADVEATVTSIPPTALGITRHTCEGPHAMPGAPRTSDLPRRQTSDGGTPRSTG